MTNISSDISGKLDSSIIALIADLEAALKSLHVRYLLVGAAARDLVFTQCFGIHAPRLTRDVDFALQVATWQEYDRVATELLATGTFSKDAKQQQRFHHRSGMMTDIVPFGNLEQPQGSIGWPPEGSVVMSTVGLREALATALVFRVLEHPVLDLRVCSPAGLALLKLISWSERKHTLPGRADAQDLAFFIRHYLDVESVHPAGAATMADVPDNIQDYEHSSAWLLGAHMAAMADNATRQRLFEILSSAVDEQSGLTLVTHMGQDEALLAGPEAYERYLRLLRALLAGLEVLLR